MSPEELRHALIAGAPLRSHPAAPGWVTNNHFAAHLGDHMPAGLETAPELPELLHRCLAAPRFLARELKTMRIAPIWEPCPYELCEASGPRCPKCAGTKRLLVKLGQAVYASSGDVLTLVSGHTATLLLRRTLVRVDVEDGRPPWAQPLMGLTRHGKPEVIVMPKAGVIRQPEPATLTGDAA